MYSHDGNIHNLNVRPQPYPFTTNYTATPEQINTIRNLPNILQISDEAKMMLNRVIASIGTEQNMDRENNIWIDQVLY